MTIGIAVLAGILYLLGWYSWSFLVVACAILMNVLTALFAMLNPDWYFRKAYLAGVIPNQTRMLIIKGVTVAVLIPIAWYIGVRASLIPISN